MTTAQGVHITLPCPPGTKMLLEVAGIPDKLSTLCIGYAKGRFVVNVRLPPEQPGQPLGRSLVHLALGQLPHLKG